MNNELSPSLKRNIFSVYLFSFFRMFLIVIPVMVPYLLKLGLNMEEVFILQASFGLVVALTEVPSGYICDIWGRKKTIVVGSLFSGCGFTWLYFCQNFWDLVIFEIVIGLGMSFVSGADFSLLYDSFPHEEEWRVHKTKAVAQIQWSKGVAEAIGSVIGGLLVSFSYQAVLLAQTFFAWAPLLVSFMLIEPPRQKMELGHSENMKAIFRHVFLKDKMVSLIFFNLVLWGLSTFIAVWIFQKYWLEEQIPLAFFGFIWAGYNLTVAFVGKGVHKWEKRFGPVALLLFMGVLPILGYWGLALVGGWLGVLVGLLFKVCRGINQVLLKDALNWRTPSEYRATINSMISLFFRLGFFIVGPLVGWTIDRYGLDKTFFSLGVCFLFLYGIALYPLVRKVRELQIDEIPTALE